MSRLFPKSVLTTFDIDPPALSSTNIRVGNLWYEVMNSPESFIRIFDISDNYYNPQLISSTTYDDLGVSSLSPSYAIIEGDYLYVVGSTGGSAILLIINISNSLSLTLESSHNLYPVFLGNIFFKKVNDLLWFTSSAVCPTSPVFFAVDISNVSAPSNVSGSFTIIDSSVVSEILSYRMDFKGNYMFIDKNEGEFAIYNISDPASPELVGVVGNENIDYPQAMLVVGDYLYIGCAEGSGGNLSLVIFNIFDPENPSFVDKIDLLSTGYNYWRGIFSVGDCLYLYSSVANFTAIRVLNIKNSENVYPIPGWAAFTNFPTNTSLFYYDDDYLTLSITNGLRIVDIKPITPQIT